MGTVRLADRRTTRLWAVLVIMSMVVSLFAAAIPAQGQVAPNEYDWAAHAPDGQDFVIDAGDLDFILDQINIAEGHARRAVQDNPDTSPLCSTDALFHEGLNMGYNQPGQTWYEPSGNPGDPYDYDTPCVGSPLLPFGLRTVSGRWNNLQGDGWSQYGAADQAFPRLLDPEWRDGEEAPGPPPVPPAGVMNYSDHSDEIIYDSEPRMISNLIVDQTLNNPAAVEVLKRQCEDGLDAGLVSGVANLCDALADGTFDEIVGELKATDQNLALFFQNVAADEGLSAPFSSWMTYFGQFFDHGLDLVEKGGNGTVIIPLQSDDPLYTPGSPTNFIPLTRATVMDGTEHDHKNRTTPFIDQNQTYTSNPSHQVFLREYDGDANPTGRLLDGPRGLATWADIKHQAATVLGIELVDSDVHNVPAIVVDPYGRFVPGPARGLPMLVTTGGGTVEGNTAAPVSTEDAVGVNHAFLDDIAHDAVPPGNRDALTDDFTGDPTYDASLLNDHFITGDGRGNENIGLTAVHHVFHSEHNRLIGQIEGVLAEGPDDPDMEALRAGYEADGFWDYEERLFQAARFVNEMQYQHLAVEEFLRTVAPSMVEVQLNESNYESDLNAAITAEFAHVVYRFGHSMLTETIPRVDANGNVTEVPLFEAFLNPRAFDDNGTIDHEDAAASIVRGLSMQVGNGIDEFVTDTLRNQLLGIPLDLATINIARGRDTGMPPLQEARRQFHAASLDPSVKPYAHWQDFRESMKNPESIVNFVAAYGIHPTLANATTIDDKRTAAQDLVDGYDAGDARDALAFMEGDPEETGLNDVDMWMGGLAERVPPFGGFVGSTFNYVFAAQANKLQNGDRFYYLVRNHGRNFFSQLEANSFSELIQRNTSAAELSFGVFAFPDPQFDVIAGTPFQYNGAEHAVIWGTNGDDTITSGDGDDTVWGRDGADRIEGGAGVDSLVGGDGNDIITDKFDDDTILGGAGNDYINGGPGLDLILAGSGSDFIVNGSGSLNGSQAFGMGGNDFILGSGSNDQIWGNLGDDWIEGGAGFDLLQGDHALGSQNDPRGGHDVIIGNSGNNDFDSDGGDDIMVPTYGVNRLEGMQGFDWVTYRDHETTAVADMQWTTRMPPDIANIRDRFDSVEGLSGSIANDVLRGINKTDDFFRYNVLDDDHLERIDGLEDLFRPGGDHEDYAAHFNNQEDPEEYLTNNILFGGRGSDILEGRGGNDFIDGDAWVNVRIEHADGRTWDTLQSSDLLDEVSSGDLDPGDLSIVREVLGADNEDGVIDTSIYNYPFEEYTITDLGDRYWMVSHLDGDDDGEGTDIVRNIEKLVFNIEDDDTGHVTVYECRLVEEDYSDSLEGLPSCEEDLDPDAVPPGPLAIVSLSTETPVVGEEISATIEWADGVNASNVAYEWQYKDTETLWTPTDNDPDVAAFVPSANEQGSLLRVVVSFDDADNSRHQVLSEETAPVIGSGEPDAGENQTDSSTEGETTTQSGSFVDVPQASLFVSEIAWLAHQNITRGCNPPNNTNFCPEGNVTRGQMAAFLNRALGLEPGTKVFEDTAGHLFEADISALEAAGITRGCNPTANTMFCPDDDVTRGQMAAFLTRALGLSGGTESFDDSVGSVFESDIAALAAAGITRGCNPPDNSNFCPDDPVTRGQMAAFLFRALKD